MFDLTANYAVSRNLASQGMVLLKNEGDLLPLGMGNTVGVVGKNCLDLIRGGGGSAHVQVEYVRSLQDGLREKAREGKFSLYEPSLDIAAETDTYTAEQLNELAEHIDTAIVTVKRFGTEGADRKIGDRKIDEDGEYVYTGEAEDGLARDDGANDYYPSAAELELFDALERSAIKNVVLILNISAVVDISYIEKYSKIRAVLLTYLPGMESGTAIADVLCGDVNPSGRLTDTIAYDIYDYPSTANFNTPNEYDKAQFVIKPTEYKEGIFVGYRYFETCAKDRVMFPFGFGLSYTTFAFENMRLQVDDGVLCAHLDVTNTGAVAGREVVQIYSSAPEGALEKPAIELRGYHKTKELQPGETEHVCVEVRAADLASFDAHGVTGYPAAWVLEAGDYTIYAGQSVRALYPCGVYTVPQTAVTEQLTLRFGGQEYVETLPEVAYRYGEDKGIRLQDVADGKATMQAFLDQLTVDELVLLAMGQPPAFPLGTAGVGNLPQYGVPNPQTADGPAGIRRSVNCTCFPCATLIACTWDEDLQFAMGKAMGFEGYSTDLDILLAPGLNIHRNPLCGRNFEYMSEDPLISGKTAAAIVRGVQSEGLCATVKHFAANNCEFKRSRSDSIIDERTLREIYLKAFEIAIKESDPAFVMTSYNLINGKKASVNTQLLKGVLRDEWGYEGAVMTDWRNFAPMDEEILAGNNIKMPYGYPDEIDRALSAYYGGAITLAQLQQNAACVLKAVMKTRAFAHNDFGVKHLLGDGVTRVPGIAVNGLSNTRLKQAQREDGEWYIYNLFKDSRAQFTFLYYVLDAQHDGEYTVAAELRTNRPQFELWYYNEKDERIGTASCASATDENAWYTVTTTLPLHQGENILKIVFADEPDRAYDFYGYFPPPGWDLHFAGFDVSE